MDKRIKAKQDPTTEVTRLKREIARLKSLEDNRKRTEEKLRESEEKYKTLTNTATAAMVMINGKGKITFWNPAAEKMFGYSTPEAVGRELHLLLAPEKYHHQYKKVFRSFKTGGEGPYSKKMIELTAIRNDGTEFPIELSLSAMDIKGTWHSIGIIRDMTDLKKAQEELRGARDDLEQCVVQRTSELLAVNRELESRAMELAEANIALKVLLKQSCEAKLDLERKMLATTQELIIPHLDRLATRVAGREEKVFINIIRNNLEQITSAFSQELTARAHNLTPREIQVADCIRSGQTTKEIAAMLNVSQATVETYRANLREKLAIKNKKINLSSYLNSLKTD